MKKISFLLCLIFSLQHATHAQSTPVKHQVAIFAPLYLDSAFNADAKYRYPATSFPKFINPGLEFYEGVQFALDSLNKENAQLEVFIYDTRSATESLSEQLDNPELDSVELIIAHCNSAEIKILAEAALKKNVPVINANLPNEGSTSANPFLVILNPTLRTQCEGIYRHIQKYYALEPMIIFRRKGSMEDRIKGYFDDFHKNTAGVPLKFRYVDLPDSFTVAHLRPYLDTVNTTICVAGSLDETFGKRLVKSLIALQKQKYNATVIGMPTWDGFGFNKSEYKGIEIIYSTPFYNSRIDKVSQSLTTKFNKTFFARPSDMVFRGYEVTFRFARMLLQHGRDISSNLANKYPKIFTDFDIQPVLNKQSMTLDYFENKKLYFLKWQDGVAKGVY